MPAKQESPNSERISSQASRLVPPDALRGLIIILMALDHANYFVARQHSPGEYWGGSFPVYHDALAFATRLVTHLAAPGFFFLMGAGMVLFAQSRRQQGWGKWAIIRHFLIRGGVLIALQLLLVNRAWGLYGVGWGYIGVLFALGGTMILGSILLWLKPRYLLAMTAALVLGTELLTPNPSQWNQAFPLLSRLL
ncbi:MAG: heparan-alpha-glucosaminide N-acetyltransferase domain-containing protein, partial [Anaerolineae bacterium]